MVTMYVLLGILLVVGGAYFFIAKEDKKKDVMEMPQGLQTFDKEGAVDVDLTARLVKIIDSFTVSSRSGSVLIPGLAGNDVWFNYERAPLTSLTKSYEPYEIDFFYPTLTVIGNTVSWDVPLPPYASPRFAGLTDAGIEQLVKDLNITIYVGVY